MSQCQHYLQDNTNNTNKVAGRQTRHNFNPDKQPKKAKQNQKRSCLRSSLSPCPISLYIFFFLYNSTSVIHKGNEFSCHKSGLWMMWELNVKTTNSLKMYTIRDNYPAEKTPFMSPVNTTNTKSQRET